MGRPYDYLIVGAGPFGSVFAYEARKRGKRCLLVEKRAHTGGNIYCSDQEGIRIHVYGAHIFHTSDQRIWDYVNQFATFNHFVNSPIANYNGEDGERFVDILKSDKVSILLETLLQSNRIYIHWETQSGFSFRIAVYT